MNYKDEQMKTKALSRVWRLIKGYEFNSFPNRQKRREGDPRDYNTTKNVQTYVKKVS